MNRLGRFFINGMILTAVSLIMRTVSVSFNVYITNIIGAEGIGLFTLISTVYGFAITVATSGISLATTRLVSESFGKKGSSKECIKNPEISCIMRKCVTYALCFSIGAAIILFFFSGVIGERILRDERTIASLKILSFTLTPIALASVLDGYFTAVRRVYKSAATQVIEQALKIFLTVILLGSLFADDVESACIVIVVGGAVAEIAAVLIKYLMYRTEKREAGDIAFPSSYGKQISKKLMGIALPVAFSAYVRSGLITIEHILIPIGLEKSGKSKNLSLAAYGTVHSMVFPIVLFPSAILGAFSGLLVPEVAQSNAAGDSGRIKNIVSNVMEIALIFSIGVAGIMMCFSYSLGDTVYPNTDAGKYIRMIAPLIPVMYFDSSVDAMLKGLGQQVYSMGVNIVDSLLSVILVWILLPRFGITGYIITVYFTEILNASLSITKLLDVSGVKPRLFTWIFKPLLATVAATSITKYAFSGITLIFASDILSLIFTIIISVVIYIALLFITGSLKLRKLKGAFRLLKA